MLKIVPNLPLPCYIGKYLPPPFWGGSTSQCPFGEKMKKGREKGENAQQKERKGKGKEKRRK
jgi:hypothetical protein